MLMCDNATTIRTHRIQVRLAAAGIETKHVPSDSKQHAASLGVLASHGRGAKNIDTHQLFRAISESQKQIYIYIYVLEHVHVKLKLP